MPEAGRALAAVPGTGDVVVGAPGADAAYVVPGAPAGTVDLLSAADVVRFTGPAGERLGAAVAVPGQVIGDPLPDLAIGAPAAGAEPFAAAGAVYVVPGQAAPGTVALGPDTAVVMAGAARFDRTGTALAAAGDVDVDGVPDLLVGAPGAKPLGRLGAGAAYVVFGSVAGDFGLLGSDGVRVAGRTGQRVGAAVAGGVDADGAPGTDVLVGAPGVADGDRTGLSALLSSPRRPAAAAGGGTCSPPLAVVLDDSAPIRRDDAKALRGDALQLLLDQPANRARLVGAVEMASQPREIFSPVRFKLARDEQQSVVEKLVRRTVGRGAAGAGADLAAGLGGALELNARARSALVVAGDATTSAAAPEGLKVDVLAVDVARGSAAEQRLRAVAAGSDGGSFRAITAEEVQAATALVDAPQRCQRALRADLGGRRRVDPGDLERVGEELDGKLDAEATVGRGEHFVDYVMSWTDNSATLQPRRIVVQERGRPDVAFTRRQVARAIRGVTVHPSGSGVTIRGIRGNASVTLRIRFLGIDVAGARVARPGRVKRVKVRHRRYGGGRAYGAAAVRAYQQFFVDDAP